MSTYVECVAILLLAIAEIIAFAKRRTLFRAMSQLVIGLGIPILVAYVSFRAGYILGAVDQYLATPSVRERIVADAEIPFSNPAVYFVVALIVATLAMRFVDQRHQRQANVTCERREADSTVHIEHDRRPRNEHISIPTETRGIATPCDGMLHIATVRKIGRYFFPASFPASSDLCCFVIQSRLISEGHATNPGKVLKCTK